jgi:hypothetical protein
MPGIMPPPSSTRIPIITMINERKFALMLIKVTLFVLHC